MGLCGNCTTWPDGAEPMYQADPDIAGIGIIIVYIASAFITLCLSAAHLVFTNSDSPDKNSFDRLVYRIAKRITTFRIDDSRRDFWVPVIQKLVLSLSDQQLLTGLAVLIAAFWTHCSISVYHFALVSDLAWFSATVHLTTLTVLEDYFLEKPVLRNWRVGLMTIMAFLLVASTVMQGHKLWYDSWPYDAQCVFDNLNGNIGGQPRYWMVVDLCLIFINYPVTIVPLCKPLMRFVERYFQVKPITVRDRAIERLEKTLSQTTSPTFFKGSMKRFTRRLSIMIIKVITWVYFALVALIDSKAFNLIINIFWFIYSLQGIIEDRDITSSEMNGDENAMTFGQIMPILLLSSLALVFREAYDDQMQELEKKRRNTATPNSSQVSLVRTRNSIAVATPSEAYEMRGAIQDNDDDDAEEENEVEHEPSSPRRVDTEMGGRSQASGLRMGQPQRRATFPMPENDGRLGMEQAITSQE